jgi:hypothetical protein
MKEYIKVNKMQENVDTLFKAFKLENSKVLLDIDNKKELWLDGLMREHNINRDNGKEYSVDYCQTHEAKTFKYQFRHIKTDKILSELEIKLDINS